MADPVEKVLEKVCNDSRNFCVGQILVRKTSAGGFALSHRDEEAADQLKIFRAPEDALEIAKYDEDERLETFLYLKQALNTTRKAANSEPAYSNSARCRPI